MLGQCHNLHSLSSQHANFLDSGRIFLAEKLWAISHVFFGSRFGVGCCCSGEFGMYLLEDQAMVAMVKHQFKPVLRWD